MKQREVDERITLDDAGVVAVIEKMLKQRKDSIAQYEQARAPGPGGRREARDGRPRRPTCRSSSREPRWRRSWREAVAASGAKAPSDMGKVMAIVKPKVAGRADMGRVSALVKAKLAG